MDISRSYAAFLVPVRIVCKERGRLLETVEKTASSLYTAAGNCGGYRKRSSPTIDTVLAFVVLVKQLCMERRWLAMVPLRQGKREGADSRLCCFGWLRSGVYILRWSPAFLVQNGGVLSLFLDWPDLRSEISVGKAAGNRCYRTGNDGPCYDKMGASDSGHISVSGGSLWRG